MNEQVLRLVAPVHRRFRLEKCALFFSALNPSRAESLLDVGGGTGIQREFEPLYRFFQTVRVLNVRPQSFDSPELGHVHCDVGDGCALPYADRSFDWVFSNAVIEHVGSRIRQQQFASEIQRVARKGYFVTTPNRNFPVDPHTLLPFYQFFSPGFQRVLCRFSPGYLKEYERIDLLSARDLLKLFPGGLVKRCGLPVFSNNLVVLSRIRN
jgi:ubiquinone/menaquinone biosynthesis C-methylase UbiE